MFSLYQYPYIESTYRHILMVLKPAPLMHDRACGVDQPFHTQEMASGPDGSYGPIWHGFPITATVNADTSTQRIDIAQATEIWQYEQDCSFLARHQENDRRKAWQYRQNLKFRRWEAHGNVWPCQLVTQTFGQTCQMSLWQRLPLGP